MTTHDISDAVAGPTGLARIRLRPRALLLGMAGALVLAGCGASAAAPSGQHNGNHSSHSGSTTLVITNPDMVTHSGVRVVTVKSGTKVEFELVSNSYHRDHTIAPWGTPRAGSPSVLAQIATPAGTKCPTNATCTFFLAKSVGTASVSAVGPSGIICGKSGGGCIAVSAIIGQVRVHVTKP